jgi:hypothetical protein
MILGSSQAAQAPEFSQLATNDGIRFDFIMTPGATQAQVTQWLNATGNSATADACEYDNEYDISHPSSDTNWPATDRANGVTVFNACKSIGASIYGPSMGGGTGGYSQVGDVSSYVDYSNIHDYFSWRNPGTGGWAAPTRLARITALLRTMSTRQSNRAKQRHRLDRNGVRPRR